MQNQPLLEDLQARLHMGFPLVGPELMAALYKDASNAIDAPVSPEWLTPDRAEMLVTKGFRFIWLTGRSAADVLHQLSTQKTSRHPMLDHIGKMGREGFKFDQPSFEELTDRGLYMFTIKGISGKSRPKGHDILQLTQSLMGYLSQEVPEAVTHLAGVSGSFQKSILTTGANAASRESLLRHPLRQALLPSLSHIVETIAAWEHINRIPLFRGRPVATASAVDTGMEDGVNPSFLVEFRQGGLYITDDSEVTVEDQGFIEVIPFVKIA